MPIIRIDRGFSTKLQRGQPVVTPPPPVPPPRQGRRRLMIIAAVGLAVGSGVAAVFLARPAPQPGPPPSAVGARVPQPAPASPAPSAVTTSSPAGSPPAAAIPPTAVTPKPWPTLPPGPKPAAPPDVAPPAPVKRPGPASIPPIPTNSPIGLLCDYFDGVPGASVETLRQQPAFPDQPNRRSLITRFELSRNRGDQYGARVRGYLVPLRTGPYRFTLCADEQAELRLSSSPAPDLARRLVNLASPVAPVAWQTRPEQTSESQNLVSGQWYYVELLLKEERGDDHAEVGWTGPGIAKPTVIDGRFLVPWGGAAHRARQAYELVQAAIAAEQRTNAAAYRYGAAALALTATRNQLQDAQARAEMDAAIARFGLLAQLRDHVQATLARTPQRSIWAMPRGLADVTGANDEGLTVAPGMIVAWSDVPPKQMLQLVNRVAPRAEGDAAAQARIALAAALFGLETGDHIEQILKHREHAIGLGDRDVTELANRLLGDPASLRVSDALARFSRLADRQSGIPAQAERHLTDLGAGAGAGLVYAVWKEQAGSSLDDARKRSVLQTPPSEVLHLDNLEAPSNRGDKFLARFQGYLIAPETGLYTFRLTCDDQGELWLGTNTAPASLQLLVRQTRAHGNRKWEEGGDQKSKPVPLVQGRRYRIEALHKEDGQTDHLSVAWQAPSATRPALLSSNHLACVFDGSLPATVATTRRKAVDDLLRLQDLAHGILQAREASVALAAGPALADQVATLQSWVALAETQARESDELLRRLGPALPALKSALRAKR